jgi:hypothetical protein
MNVEGDLSTVTWWLCLFDLKVTHQLPATRVFPHVDTGGWHSFGFFRSAILTEEAAPRFAVFEAWVPWVRVAAVFPNRLELRTAHRQKSPAIISTNAHLSKTAKGGAALVKDGVGKAGPASQSPICSRLRSLALAHLRRTFNFERTLKAFGHCRKLLHFQSSGRLTDPRVTGLRDEYSLAWRWRNRNFVFSVTTEGDEMQAMLVVMSDRLTLHSGDSNPRTSPTLSQKSATRVGQPNFGNRKDEPRMPLRDRSE